MPQQGQVKALQNLRRKAPHYPCIFPKSSETLAFDSWSAAGEGVARRFASKKPAFASKNRHLYQQNLPFLTGRHKSVKVRLSGAILFIKEAGFVLPGERCGVTLYLRSVLKFRRIKKLRKAERPSEQLAGSGKRAVSSWGIREKCSMRCRNASFVAIKERGHASETGKFLLDNPEGDCGFRFGGASHRCCHFYPRGLEGPWRWAKQRDFAAESEVGSDF
jgi:hypothetical protein